MRPAASSRIATIAMVLLLAQSAPGAHEARAQAPPVFTHDHGTPSAPDPLFDDSDGDEGGGGDALFDDEFDQPSGYPDPIESTNRHVLGFNSFVDRWVFDPITRAYQFVVPDPARRAVYRFFLNLNSPPILANDILQLEWKDAGVTLGRFVINTTVGVVGFFDVADSMGLERHEADFGQTLQLANVPSGPYVVLPIFGPSTLRDTAGGVMDSLFNPTTWFFGLGLGTTFVTQTPLTEQLLYTGTAGLSTRDAHYEALKALKESSVDFYAALRSAFYQNREAEIWERRSDRLRDWQVPY